MASSVAIRIGTTKHASWRPNGTVESTKLKLYESDLPMKANK